MDIFTLFYIDLYTFGHQCLHIYQNRLSCNWWVAGKIADDLKVRACVWEVRGVVSKVLSHGAHSRCVDTL